MTLSPDLREGDFLAAAQALLPRGPAWPREPEAVQSLFWQAVGARFAALHARARDLLERESDPAQTSEMLGDWERAFGLPDDCTPVTSDTTARRSALLARIAARGGQSRAYFIEVAAALGYTVTITEFRPFRAGINAPGDSLTNGEWIFTWRVNAAEETVTTFAAGAGSAGDALRAWGNETLECVLSRLKPARTTVLFAYGS